MSKKIFEIVSDFKIKQASEEEDFLTIEGYANTTTKDRVGDIILSEAWNKGGMDNYLSNPILLAYHDHTNPIGMTINHSIDDKGLKITANVFKEAGNVYNLIKRNVLKAFSVGFMVKDADYDTKTDIFVIKDVELFEVSVVSVPANPNSIFSVKKSFSDNTEGLNRFIEEFSMSEENTDGKTEGLNTDSILKTVNETIDSKLEVVVGAIKSLEEVTNQKKEENNDMTVEGGDNRLEDLLADVEKRLEEKFVEKESSLTSTIESLRSELDEKSKELADFAKSKMQFTDKEGRKPTNDEIDTAVLLSKALQRPIIETKFGKGLIEKAGPHLASMTEDWEQEFSTRLENDIRERLIMEPMFRTIPMNTPSMHIPINPEAAYGSWIASTYPPLGSVGDNTSTGGDEFGVDAEPQRHLLEDTTLTAYKLVAKEYIAYEEEEDTIIPLTPIIRDAIMRRMAKSADKALLRGQASGSTDPLKGVAKYAADGSAETTLSVGGGEKATVADLQTIRRDLGVWGHNPGELVYIVSHDVYYDLLEDPDFRTMDLVGTNATILRGQIGSCNGSPVVVSGEFEAKAATKYAAVCLNASNYIVGSLRGLMVERDKNIEDQRNIIVASRRWGFLQIIANKGASVLTWAA